MSAGMRFSPKSLFKDKLINIFFKIKIYKLTSKPGCRQAGF